MRTPVFLSAVLGAGLGIAGIVLTLLQPSSLVGTAGRVAAVVLLAVAGTVLSAIDLRSHRLPDRVLLPSLAVLALVATLIAAADDEWWRLGRALLGAAALFGGFLMLALLVPGSLGGGDVKLAALIGGAAAWGGWGLVPLTLLIAFVSAGVVALLLRACGRLAPGARIAFGPALLLGCATATLLSS